MNWPVVALGDLLTFENGRALHANHRRPGIVPVVGSGGVIGNHGHGLVDGPGIVVGRKGHAGTVTWLDTMFWPIDTTYYVRPKVRFHLRWVYHLLRHLNFADRSQSTGVKSLRREDICGLRFPLPPVRHQRDTAALLDQLAGTIKQFRDADNQSNTILPLMGNADMRKSARGFALSWESQPTAGTLRSGYKFERSEIDLRESLRTGTRVKSGRSFGTNCHPSSLSA